MLTKILQELDSVLLLCTFNVGLLVSGTILILSFFYLVFVPFPVCTTRYKACLMRLI